MNIINNTIEITGIYSISKFSPLSPNVWPGIRFIDEDNSQVFISMDTFMSLYENLRKNVEDRGIDWDDFRN